MTYSESEYYPLITIVIPVYNGKDFLSKAIDSALAQTYERKEILVISDGSTDGSDEIALGYGDKIRFLRKDNGGVSSVLNTAIREMKGTWLSWLSHDDTYYPDKLSEQVKELNEIIKANKDRNIEEYVICCSNDRIDANGNPVKRKIKYGKNFDDPISLLISQIKRYTIGGCCVLASRSAYEAIGGFNEKNRTCSDAEMWYEFMLRGYKFVFIPKVLVHSRQHNGMVSVTKKDLCKKEGTLLHAQILKSAFERGLSEKQRFDLLCALSARGYYRLAKENLKISSLSVFRKASFFVISTYYVIKNTAKSILRKIYRKIKY